MADKPRLLFVVTEDWYFASHRFALARAAKGRGFRCRARHPSELVAPEHRVEGIRVIPLQYMRRSSRHPWVELQVIRELSSLYRDWKPDVVHHVAPSR